MNCSRPTISFDVGGIRDAVHPGETGLLADAGDAIAALLDDDAMRARLGAGALALTRREFSAELQAERFETLYRSLVEQRAV